MNDDILMMTNHPPSDSTLSITPFRHHHHFFFSHFRSFGSLHILFLCSSLCYNQSGTFFYIYSFTHHLLYVHSIPFTPTVRLWYILILSIFRVRCFFFLPRHFTAIYTTPHTYPCHIPRNPRIRVIRSYILPPHQPSFTLPGLGLGLCGPAATECQWRTSPGVSFLPFSFFSFFSPSISFPVWFSFS